MIQRLRRHRSPSELTDRYERVRLLNLSGSLGMAMSIVVQNPEARYVLGSGAQPRAAAPTGYFGPGSDLEMAGPHTLIVGLYRRWFELRRPSSARKFGGQDCCDCVNALASSTRHLDDRLPDEDYTWAILAPDPIHAGGL
ncbi:MAG: hypothetical protein V9E82_03970 [Candidatus Nanopelagicales bacterium]